MRTARTDDTHRRPELGFLPLPPAEGRGEGSIACASDGSLTLTLSRGERGPEPLPLPPGEGRGEGSVACASDGALTLTLCRGERGPDASNALRDRNRTVR